MPRQRMSINRASHAPDVTPEIRVCCDQDALKSPLAAGVTANIARSRIPGTATKMATHTDELSRCCCSCIALT